MKIVAFQIQKGGSGKTTLAVHVAVAAHEAGRRVVVIDTDPQASATVWSEARTAEEPLVITIIPAQLAGVLETAKSEGIDTAPHAAPEAAAIARAADLVILPVRPTAFDLAAAGRAVLIVRAAGVRAAFVLSACPVRAPETADARAALAAHGLAVAGPEITEQRAFARAIAHGAGGDGV